MRQLILCVYTDAMTKTLCARCGDNYAQIDALCNECVWRVLTNVTTFTVADMEAMWVNDHTDLALEMTWSL